MPNLPPERAAASAIARVLDPGVLSRALEPWLPDAGERAYMVRCIIGEGPIHHRGASYALIALAALIADRLGIREGRTAPDAIAVAMRLPPHLAGAGGPPAYPLRLDPDGLGRLAPGDPGAQALLVDAVTDGPPHHALANVALLNLLAAILRRVEAAP